MLAFQLTTVAHGSVTDEFVVADIDPVFCLAAADHEE